MENRKWKIEGGCHFSAKSGSLSRRSLAIELAAVTALLLAIARGLFLMRGVAPIGQSLQAIVAVLFLYAPIAVLWLRRRPVDFLDRGWKGYRRSLVAWIVASLAIFPPFLLAAHGWQILVEGRHHFQAASFTNPLGFFAFQLLLVALPEEFYFRGYFQSAADAIFRGRVRILGADVGWGLVVTAAAFAVAHSIVLYRWWHFAIFFPALAFGYLRSRTGSITAPVLFHASSNILMDWVTRSYV